MNPDPESDDVLEHYPKHTAAAKGLASCHGCGLVSPVWQSEECPRCGASLHLRKENSLQRTIALTLTALVLYFPANLFPIMTVKGIGKESTNTILEGVINFWKTGSYSVALIIFTASVIIPILKFIALIWLCIAARPRKNDKKRKVNPRQATLVFRVLEIIGRWSMVDVFVVAVMVAVVQFGSFMSIAPGPAALSFAGVVILTMFAAESFDSRILWDRVDPKATYRALTPPLTLPPPRAPVTQSPIHE